MTREGADWLAPRRTRALNAREGVSTNWREDDPIFVIYTPSAQFLICLGCLVYFRPEQLLPMPWFVAVGAQFLREHRFCKPHHDVQELFRRATAQREREPGEEG